MRKLLILIVIGLLIIPLYPVVEGAQERAEWTIMIYMGGGSDYEMSQQVEEDLAQIEASSPGAKVEVIVLSDQFQEGDSKLWYHCVEGLREEPLSLVNQSWIDEVNMAHSQTLREFVRWSKENHPAERYMLYLWGHGDGWKGMPLEDGEALHLYDIEKALRGFRFDVLGFDTCAMGTFEVYYQLKDNAEMIIASPLDIPMQGLPYDVILDRIGNDPEKPALELSRIIVDEFVSWSLENTSVRTGLAAVKTSELPIAEFENYTSRLISSLPYFYGGLERAWNSTEAGTKDDGNLFQFSLNVGMEVNCGRLKLEGINLREAINRSIAFQGGNQDERVDMSVYFPTEYSSLYNTISFSDIGWASWLDDFRKPPSPGEVNMSFHVDQQHNIVSVEFCHDMNNASVEVDVHTYYDNVLGYTFNESSVNFVFKVTPGEYSIEAYLFNQGNLYHHFSESVVYEKYVVMKGFVDHDGGIEASIRNTRTDAWINRSLEKGNYSIDIPLPEFCEPGDVLEITYISDQKSDTYVVEVPDEGEFTVNFSQEDDVIFPWITAISVIAIVMVVGLYIKTRFELR